jgi:hypothetical protein
MAGSVTGCTRGRVAGLREGNLLVLTEQLDLLSVETQLRIWDVGRGRSHLILGRWRRPSHHNNETGLPAAAGIGFMRRLAIMILEEGWLINSRISRGKSIKHRRY